MSPSTTPRIEPFVWVDDGPPDERGIESLDTLLVCLSNRKGWERVELARHHPPDGRIPGQFTTASKTELLVESLGWVVVKWMLVQIDPTLIILESGEL